MANPEHLAILRQGVESWNSWRRDGRAISPDLREAYGSGENFSRCNFRRANLRGADFSGANLSEVDLGEADLSEANIGGVLLSEAKLYGANLYRANLRGARLNEARFNGADLRGANLSDTVLIGAKLSGADLTGAKLRGARLNDADFSGTKLDDADLSNARVSATVFARINLGVVKGLETLIHVGPSIIDIDTIYKSGGEIPDVFLRGAGVPDNFITYVRSLVGKPIEFYSCFISYSSQNQDFANRLFADLQAAGVRCWFAPHHVAGGQKLHEQIDEAIRLHERLLLILSPASMESEWVETEIAKARKREVREKRRVLFPVRLADFDSLRDWECFDADTGKDSAREIREYFIPDFSQWKDHDSYQLAFDRLLRDLKTEAQKT